MQVRNNMPTGIYPKEKRRGIFKKGLVPWNKGKKMTAEQTKNMYVPKPNAKGEKNYRWKGGYENTLWYNRQRRIKRLENGGSHTLGDWENLKAQYNWTCPACKKSEPKIKLTVDHIIPLSKGGSDNIENIQPLCGSCNYKKWTKVVIYEK